VKQLSLVAFYGAKDRDLWGRIRACQRAIRSGLPPGTFSAYAAKQVHATIAGMERLDGRLPPIARNAWRARKVESVMDFRPLREVVARNLPLAIRIGGFARSARGFTSRGETPHARSFQIQLAAGRATLIGWPHEAGDFGRRRLAALRADLARSCRIEHKYDDDNDLFFVLGTLAGDTADVAPAAARVEREVRDGLAAHPLQLELTLERVHVACYESESLDPRSTRAYPIDDPRLTPEFLAALYEA
jgi:hypothetical protein